MIIVRPTSGLCNRMRVIDSCISLLKKNPRHEKIKMVWECNEWLNCAFEDLFEPIPLLEVGAGDSRLNYFLFYRGKQLPTIKSRLKRKIYERITRSYRFVEDKEIVQRGWDEAFWDGIKGPVIIDTYVSFYSEEFRNGQMFRPVPTLAQRVEAEVAKFVQPVTGVHIRRTDGAKAAAVSTSELFVKHIEAALQKDSEQLFYLATDDAEEEDMMRRHFGGHIISQAGKDLKRDSKKGIEDALVDLYALSRTSGILGSYWSSFSATAAGLRGIPLTIVS